MNEAIVFFACVALTFVVLLGLEWRYSLKTLRVVSAVLAMAMLFFFQPNYHAAWRRAMSTPPSERVTDIGSASLRRPLSEYESGVTTMYDAVVDNAAGYHNERLLAMGVLFWLACSPVFRRKLGASKQGTLPDDTHHL